MTKIPYKKTEEYRKKQREHMRKVYETKKGQALEHAKRRTPENRYAHAVSNARRRGKEFTLGFEEYTFFISHPCFYCNVSLSDETGTGLDRIDNDGGYTLTNVNPCCKSCNRIRSKSMSAEEFKKQTKLNGRWNA